METTINKTKFTPGPWKFLFELTPEAIEETAVPPGQGHEGFLSRTILIGNQKDECLAEIKAFTTSGFLQNFSEFEGNARLIAAAPEMYDALIMVTEQLEVFSDEDVSNKNPMREAIKIAKGLLNRINP